MSQSLLNRAISCLQTGATPPEPVRDYMLSILDKRKKPRKVTPVRPTFKRLLLPISRLKKELDKEFSIFIRTRGIDRLGCNTCVTCGRYAPWRSLDCGHYCPRQDMSTRWDEKNCYPQCGPCNAFRGGEPEKMAIHIDRVHGPGTAELLRGKARRGLKLNRHVLQMWIDHYKKLNKGAGPAQPEQ